MRKTIERVPVTTLAEWLSQHSWQVLSILKRLKGCSLKWSGFGRCGKLSYHTQVHRSWNCLRLIHANPHSRIPVCHMRLIGSLFFMCHLIHTGVEVSQVLSRWMAWTDPGLVTYLIPHVVPEEEGRRHGRSWGDVRHKRLKRYQRSNLKVF